MRAHDGALTAKIPGRTRGRPQLLLLGSVTAAALGCTSLARSWAAWAGGHGSLQLRGCWLQLPRRIHGRKLRAAAVRRAAVDVAAGTGVPPSVHIVDGHGDALQHWEALPGDGYTVLHLDSHADMFLDFRPADPEEAAGSARELRERLAPQVHLSNFIPLGILGGKVQRVVWLRSDFESCRYNGPPPGEYELTVGAPASSADSRPALCYWQRGGRSFQEYTFMPDPLRGGYEILSAREGWPAPERNPWFEKVPYLLDAFGLYLLGEPMGTPFSPPHPGLEQHFDLSVVTSTQLAADEEAGAEFLTRQLQGAPWVLDVDLDFFSTLAPALAPAVRRLRLPPAEANRLGQWSQELAVVVEAIEEEDPSSQAFRVPLIEVTVATLLALGSHVTALAVVDALREVDPGSYQVREDLSDRLASLLQGLTEEDRRVWQHLELSEWDALVASPHGPHFVASRAAVREAAASLERQLRSLVQRGLPCPAAVTVARSTDLYLPLDLGPFIEEQMLSVLQNLGWANAAHGSAPPWPAGAGEVLGKV